jgi:hypothetical protein
MDTANYYYDGALVYSYEPFKRRVESHMPSAGIISSPYFPR